MQPTRRRSFYRRRKTIRIYIRASERMHRSLALAAGREASERGANLLFSRSKLASSSAAAAAAALCRDPPLFSTPAARCNAERSEREERPLERAYGMAYIGAKAAPVQQLPRFCPPASADHAPRRGPPPASPSSSLFSLERATPLWTASSLFSPLLRARMAKVCHVDWV